MHSEGRRWISVVMVQNFPGEGNDGSREGDTVHTVAVNRGSMLCRAGIDPP